jgi:predicted nucleotidyltransferase component of viral defense system
VKTPRKNLVASILARLRNEANEQGVPFNQVLQFYAIERFLYRLSHSRHVDGVLLKGALLLKTVGIPRARPTMDIDFLRQGRADRDSLIALVKDCALVEGDADGVTFDASSIVAEEIAKEAVYRGMRVQIAGRMENVRLSIQIDFGVGDVVVPGPRVIEYPSMLDQPALKLRAYPIEAAIAEKFQAMVELDVANSRMKDFYDIWTYARSLDFDGSTLARSIAATFERRATPLPLQHPTAFTSQYFAADAHARQWRAFSRRIGELGIANDFGRVATDTAAFVMPPTLAAAHREKFEKIWPASGPWSD